MGRKPRWTDTDVKNKIQIVTLSSWKYFHDYIQEEFLNYRDYVFRGQCNENWLLEPTLNRFLKDKKVDYNQTIKDHLQRFKYSIRGRTNEIKELSQKENELWALGQHHGLYTPLLDFSTSPYVAAFFAFIDNEKNTEYRSIYAIHQTSIRSDFKEDLTIFKPLSDYNPRLLNQSGLFIKFEKDNNIEDLFKNKYQKYEENDEVLLVKIRIPNKDRNDCLRLLNRMNINHNTLFPDLEGTSLYCNMDLNIKDY